MIKGECPSKCAYCYYQKHLKDLYPSCIDKEDLILHNLNLFLDFYVENHLTNSIEIFSGRFLQTDWGFKVLDSFYEHFKDIRALKPKMISIPDDMQFYRDEIIQKRIREWIDRMTSINVPICFSFSIDGGGAESNLRHENKDEKFYKDLLQLADDYQYCFHPMVSAINIHEWINGKLMWWINYLGLDRFLTDVMMLEVRDNNWDEDAINGYLNLMNIIYDIKWYYYNDIKKFTEDVFCIVQHNRHPTDLLFNGSLIDPAPSISCSIQHALHIRLGDLAIVPCHRLAYPQFITGNFLVEDNKITGIKGANVPMLIGIHSQKLSSLPRCHNCDFRYSCIGACHGSSYETEGDPFWVGNTVCDLEQARICFGLIKMAKMNVLSYCKEQYPQLYQQVEKAIEAYRQYKKIFPERIAYMEELINNGNARTT